MNAPNSFGNGLRLLFAVLLVGALGGCGKPTEDARQNRRLVDALLTAVTVRNPKEMEKCKGLLDKRRADGVLSESSHQRLLEIFAQAKSGKWSEAEDALYRFRESDPFPK
ncbi:MAG: hypothetical protein ABGY75_02470 [Gemmataceae bacterium]